MRSVCPTAAQACSSGIVVGRFAYFEPHAPDADRARRDEHRAHAGAVERDEVAQVALDDGQIEEPARVEEARRADLHDDPPGALDLASHGGSSRLLAEPAGAAARAAAGGGRREEEDHQ